MKHVSLASGRLLARNTAWSLLGTLLPMAVALVAIPLLIRGLGMDRFGLLSLAWIVVGYFSLVDLGIGRALTKRVADSLAASQGHEIPPLVWTSLLLLLLLGILGGLATFAVSPWLVSSALKVPVELQAETLVGFYLLAVSIPTVTVTSGLRGILEAQQRFRTLNLIRIPMSIFSFAGPLLVLPFSSSLVPVIGILVVGRILGLLAYLLACFHAMPALRHNLVLQRSVLLSVVRLGAWMNVTTLLHTVMIYLDRFLIGALVSVSALAYYTPSLEMVARLEVVPAAVSGVFFPAFASSLVRDPERTKVLLSRGVKYIFLAVFPVVLVIATFAPEILRLWLGVPFAQNGSSVLRWFAAGAFANYLAQLPYDLLQSAGRPDIPAKLQLAELPLYVCGLLLLVKAYGIQGAAVAWAGRITVEAIFLFLLAHRLLPHKPGFLPKLTMAAACGFLVLCATSFPQSLATRIGLVLPSLLVFVVVGWRWVLEPKERAFMLRGRGDTLAEEEAFSDV